MLEFWIRAIVIAVAAYFCGCFNGAVIVSKYILHDDVRNHGSGNAGLTNFYRTFGGPLTFVVILCDVLKAVVAILHKKPVGLRFRPQEVTYLVTYKQQGAKTYLNYIRNVIRFKCDWKKRLFSSSYTAFSEMVVTDRTESPLSGISNKNTFKRKQVFYDLVDEYWNEDFWRNYNIIEPTESLENAVSKLRKQSN